MSLPLADESVDLVVTSPPYFALRSYTDSCSTCEGSGWLAATPATAEASGRGGIDCPECNGTGRGHYDGQIGSEATPQAFLEALWAVTAECRRVLKPSGSMFVNLGDKYSGVQPAAMRNGGLDRPRSTEANAKITAKNVDFGIPAKSLMLLPQRYAIGCIDQLGLICRAEVIWSKPNGLPESVTDRVRRSHEQWFMFTKQPRYFSAVDEVREPSDTGNRVMYQSSRGKGRGLPPRGPSDFDDRLMANNPLGKLPGSVWTIPTEPLKVPDHLGVDHFAAFPSEWPRRIILGWSPSGVCVACGEGRRPVVAKEYTPAGGVGNESYRRDMDDARDDLVAGRPKFQEMPLGRADMTATITGYACACPDTTAPTRPAVVLDPFCGTGTTPAVAHALGRHGIGIDLSADYLRLADWRCNDPVLRAKVLRVERPKAVPDGQLDIFGEVA